MKTILTPIDFSAVTRNVVDQAAALAKVTKSKLVLLHVVQPPKASGYYGGMVEYVPPPVETVTRSVSREMLRWKRHLGARGVTPIIIQSSGGSAALLIVKEAKRRSASYIVIGSHGHTAFYDLLIGSTTSGVVKRSPCPVLIVPAHHKPTKGSSARD